MTVHSTAAAAVTPARRKVRTSAQSWHRQCSPRSEREGKTCIAAAAGGTVRGCTHRVGESESCQRWSKGCSKGNKAKYHRMAPTQT